MGCKGCEEKAANRMKNIQNTKAFDFSLVMRFAVSAKVYLEQYNKLGDIKAAAEEGPQCFECLINILNGEMNVNALIKRLDLSTKELASRAEKRNENNTKKME